MPLLEKIKVDRVENTARVGRGMKERHLRLD